MHGRLFEPKQKTIDAIREAIALERLSTIEQTPEPAVLEQEPPIEAVEMELALPGRLEQLSLFFKQAAFIHRRRLMDQNKVIERVKADGGVAERSSLLHG